ncbi:hypothetical protein [Bacillus suaedae]|uniref:Uncharacterized protein n=1 Tax=Halalkalibacter suaedae TaxID=2822140 RepID=A0A941AP71_9BACI|nr:hypothetical protein [Bacillus suaedae]MBP3951177.1 hypothetical protein [Bacillus suaedae]
MKKGTLIWIALASLLVIIGFVIPVNVSPPDDTRIILDHTLKVYSSPACFDQADLTNNLEEATYADALSLGYEGESACTNDELLDEQKSFWFSLFQ